MATASRLLPIARRFATPSTSRLASPQLFRAGSRRTFTSRTSLFVKKYTEDHEWIEIGEGGKTGTIGITTYASKALGDVVYVELPEPGLQITKGDAIGAVESVKSASDILSPVSGTITASNEVLAEKPGVINKGPEGEGWFAKIEIGDVKELEGLMSKEEYDAFEKE